VGLLVSMALEVESDQEAAKHFEFLFVEAYSVTTHYPEENLHLHCLEQGRHLGFLDFLCMQPQFPLRQHTEEKQFLYREVEQNNPIHALSYIILHYFTILLSEIVPD